MDLTEAAAVWAVLGLGAFVLALYRKFLSSSEIDVVHLGAGEEKEIPKQPALAARLASIDRWGKVLTVVVVLAGICLAIAYLYAALHDPAFAPALRNFYKRHEP